jgi:tetratricopeptide (TPR) repeat protein/predicted aspartyl protease
MPSMAACKRQAIDLPVSISGTRPLIPAKINGVDVHFLVDSGAFFSMISAATAEEFKLKMGPAPYGLTVRGVGGSVSPYVATVKDFTLANADIHNVEFLVGGSEGGNGSVGFLGQNLLQQWDVEYDLAKGMIRLMKDEDCRKNFLAYWAAPDQPVTLIDIGHATPLEPQTTGIAYANGVKIRVVFDTGAGTSVMSLKAAARAGVKPESPGVVDAGFGHGIGRGSIKSYIAPFDSFKFADGEQIQHTRLRIADIDLELADMLIGADFFLSHRVFVANSQHKLYFTYNGGPVFNLSTSQKTAPIAPNDTANSAQQAAPNLPPSSAAAAAGQEAEPADAAAFARRGTAFAGRREFDPAIADLTHAVQLEPTNAEYFFERGVVYRRMGQSEPASADFNRALELKPDYVLALMNRAELRLNAKDLAGVRSDLEAVDKLTAKEADVRLEMARLYARADLLPAAIEQLDSWILAHNDDARMVTALNERCRSKALLGQDLDGALKDCNKALGRSLKGSNGAIYDSRGLVRLRRGEYDKSIADYDASLQLSPQLASSLYGRGIALIRNKQDARGSADMAAAEKLAPNIAQSFERRGIVP